MRKLLSWPCHACYITRNTYCRLKYQHVGYSGISTLEIWEHPDNTPPLKCIFLLHENVTIHNYVGIPCKP